MGRDNAAAGTFTEISRLKQKGLLGVVQPSQVSGGSGKSKVATATKWKVRAIEFGESQRSLRNPVKDFVLNITSSKSGKVKGSYVLAAQSFCAIVRIPLPPLVMTAAAPYGTGSTAGGSSSGSRKATTLPMMCLLNDKCEGVALREHASDTVKLDNWYRSIVEALVGLDKYVQLPVLDSDKKELTVHVTPYNVSVTPREPITTLCTRDHRIWQTSAVDMTICPDSNVLCISPRYGPPIVYKLQEGCSTSVVVTIPKILRLAVESSTGQQLAPPPISPSGNVYDSPRQPAALPPFVRSVSAEQMSNASQQSPAAQLTVSTATPGFATLQRSQPRPPPSLPTDSGGSSCGSSRSSIGSSSGTSIGSSVTAVGGAALAAAPWQHLSPRPLPRKPRDAAETIGGGPPPDSEAPSVGVVPNSSAGSSTIADADVGEPRELISPRPSPRAGHVASWGTGGVGGQTTSQASFANVVDSRQEGQDDCPPAAGFPFLCVRVSDNAVGSRAAIPCDGSPLPAPRRTHAVAPSCSPNDKITSEAPRSSEAVVAAGGLAVQPKSDVSQVRSRLVDLASLHHTSDESSDSEDSDSIDDDGCLVKLPPLVGPDTLTWATSASTERYQEFEIGDDPDVDIYQSYDEGPNESLYANLHELYSLYVNTPDDRLKPALPPRRQRPGDNDGCGGHMARSPPPPLPLRKGMRPNIAATLDRIIDRIPPSAGCDPFGLKSHVRRDFCWQLALKDSITGSWQDLASRAIELTAEEIGMIEKFSKDYRFPPPEIVLHHWQYLHFVKCNDMLLRQPTRINLIGILQELGREDLVEFLNRNR